MTIGPRILLPALLLSAAAAQAATPAQRFLQAYPGAGLSLREGSSTPSLVTGFRADLSAKGDRAQAAADFVRGWMDLLGAQGESTTLAPAGEAGVDGVVAYRFEQRYRGLRVLDRSVVLTVDREGKAFILGNGLEPVAGVPTAFAVTQVRAERAAAEAVKPVSWGGAPARAEQVVAVLPSGPRAVWAVEIAATRPLGRWRVLVDGQTGQLVGRRNLLRHAKGYVYPNCPERGAYQEVALQDLTSTTALSGSVVDVYSNCIPSGPYGTPCDDTFRQALPDSNGDFLYLPQEGNAIDPFAEVMAYYHLSDMKAFFSANGYTGLDDVVMGISVNFTGDPDMACNAGYLGDSIVVGLCTDGAAPANFAYDSNIIMHEYTHGAVDHGPALGMAELDDWGLNVMPSGLNEGYADLFPAIAHDDPEIGVHVSTALGEGAAMRDLSVAKTCPDHLVGESHADGEIWASANWAAYVASGKDPALPKALLTGMIALPAMATFKDAANATLAAAANLGANVKDGLRNAYRAQGLLGCGREIGILSGQTQRGVMLHPWMYGLGADAVPSLIQWKLAVPDGATALRVEVKATIMGHGGGDGGDGIADVNVFVREGTHVSYAGGNPVSTWNAKGQPALTVDAPKPGVYYILLQATNFDRRWGYHFEMTPTIEGLPAGPDAGSEPDAASDEPDAAAGEADAGVADDAGASEADAGRKALGGGCGCAAGGGAGLAWAAGAALVGLLRRRRGRSPVRSARSRRCRAGPRARPGCSPA